jgi:hypothetical protein
MIRRPGCTAALDRRRSEDQPALGALNKYSFCCVDECASYFVSRRPVVPAQVEVVDDVLAALLGRGA